MSLLAYEPKDKQKYSKGPSLSTARPFIFYRRSNIHNHAEYTILAVL